MRQPLPASAALNLTLLLVVDTQTTKQNLCFTTHVQTQANTHTRTKKNAAQVNHAFIISHHNRKSSSTSLSSRRRVVGVSVNRRRMRGTLECRSHALPRLTSTICALSVSHARDRDNRDRVVSRRRRRRSQINTCPASTTTTADALRQ